MRRSLKIVGVFLISFATGTLYAVVVGLVSGPLRAPLYAWPILTALFGFIFWKFNVLRYVGFIWVLPGALIGFEWFWSISHPGMVADKYTTHDRSHYVPGRIQAGSAVESEPDMFGSGMKEVFFGADWFPADPQTSKGNPDRCRFVLIGDSMVYGSGLPYPSTFGPVLAGMGIDACVFGVTGNSPIDYLATLRYVAHRIEPDAHVAFYLYAYNDFVSLSKYFSRGVLSLSNRFPRLFDWASSFDKWRQSTFTFAWITARRGPRRGARCLDCDVTNRPSGKLWQYDVGKAVPIKVLYPQDPAEYRQPKGLNKRQRAALQFFFERLKEIASGRSWRVAIVIHPDEIEFYANLARRATAFVDLDPRRGDAITICKEYGFSCTDISRYLYERSLAEGKNPYFINNRHFSIAGTRIVAESFVAQSKPISQSSNAPSLISR